MIERGHQHHLTPYSVHDYPDGVREVQSRCACGLEQKLACDQAGTPTGLQFRFGGLWFIPTDLVRLFPVPVEECATCNGEPPPIQGMPPCSACGGIGVTADGAMVRLPALVSI